MNLMRGHFASLGIRRQIILISILVYLMVIGVSMLVFRGIYTNLVLSRMSAVTQQTLYLVTAQVEGTLETVEGYGDLISTDDAVQAVLGPEGKDDAELMTEARSLLSRSVASSPLLISAFLYGPESYILGVNPGFLRERFQIDAPEFEWFWRMGEAERDAIHYTQFNEDRTLDSWVPYVSCVRVIRSAKNHRILGFILLNYDVSPIRHNVTLPGLSEPNVILLNEYGQTIATTDRAREQLAPFLDENGRLTESPSAGSRDWTASFVRMENGWNAGIITSRDEIAGEVSVLGKVSVGGILLASTMVFSGLFRIINLLIRPIRSLTEAFTSADDVVPPRVDFPAWNRDVESLRDGYNSMVEHMELLLEKTVRAERERSLDDLRLFQAQVKPHFLYNTFDTICALALKGDNESVYKGMLALGKFYRTTLSAGLDLIPFRKEVESIRNYMAIQKLRYVDLVEDRYEIAPGLDDFLIPKLILQPLVENALYHGLKPLGESGTITLHAIEQESRLIVEIRDDGVGFSSPEAGEGFGLHSTRERLRLFFGEDDLLEIDSREGVGTAIRITIPGERSPE